MWYWLLQPISPHRVHELDLLLTWHARSMVLAWVVIAPIAVIGARFFKILPYQGWPSVVDSQHWWRLHWISHSLVFCVSVLSVGLLTVRSTQPLQFDSIHSWLGAIVLALLVLQLLSGLLRGSKGGPSADKIGESVRGDHYDMTLRRRLFESLHKSAGYLVLSLALINVFVGLWLVNAPRWMWLAIIGWYLGVVAVYVALQRAGWAADTYEAIWGPDPSHPGNRRPSQGWGMRRRGDSAHELQSKRKPPH